MRIASLAEECHQRVYINKSIFSNAAKANNMHFPNWLEAWSREFVERVKKPTTSPTRKKRYPHHGCHDKMK